MSDYTVGTAAPSVTWPPYPAEYPYSVELREILRSMHLERETLKGVHKGLRYGLSMRCVVGDHGCRNDGSGCLCRCHDQKEQT